MFEVKATLGRVLDFSACPNPNKSCWPDLYVSGGGRETQMFHTRRVRKPHVTMSNSIYSYFSTSIVSVVHKDLQVWDVMTGKENLEIKNASTHEITSIAMDVPLQRKLYVGNSFGVVNVFNAFTGSKISEAKVHSGAVIAIIYCPISKHVITTSYDKSIRVFKESKGDLIELRTLVSAHRAQIVCATYSYQLSIVATVAAEEIKLWDFQDLQLQDHLDLHATEVTAINFVTNTPILATADIQGRILLWLVTPRASMSSASCKCLVSCVLNPENFAHTTFHNVRNMNLLMDPSDADEQGMPLALVASDFSGMMAFWKIDDIGTRMGGIEIFKPTEVVYFDEESYNPDLRYQKDGVFAATKINNSRFPDTEVWSSNQWQAHEEPILSMSCLRGAPMVVTTAADCRLRLWAAAPCKVGIRDCEPGELFGEIDSMDYEEQRIERLEHWNVPNVQSVDELEEYKTIVRDALDKIEREAQKVGQHADMGSIPR